MFLWGFREVSGDSGGGGVPWGFLGGSRWVRGFTDTLLFVVIKDTYGLGGDKTSFANLFNNLIIIIIIIY